MIIASDKNSTVSEVITPELISYYYWNATKFVEDMILHPASKILREDIRLAPDQRRLTDAAPYETKIAIESGHGTGKSSGFSFLINWFLFTRANTIGEPVKVPCAAPTFHQLYDILWVELKRWLPLSLLSDYFEINQTEFYIKGLKDNCWARARSVSKSDNIQGFHAPHLMWIVDEAFGVTDNNIWETIEGSLTDKNGDNRIVIGGQHTVIIGYVHDTFHRDKDDWFTMTFSSVDSPLAHPDYARRIARRYGIDSDVYRVRVLGTQPRGNPESFIQLTLVMAAQNRTEKLETEGIMPGSRRSPLHGTTLTIGVDVARFGDDTSVITIVQGFHVHEQIIVAKHDSVDVAAKVLAAVRKYRRSSGITSTVEVRVDGTGGFGSGVIDLLRRNQTDNIKVIEVVSHRGGGNEDYADMISIMWGELRDWLEYGSIPDDPFLEEEIVGREFSLADGKVRIEEKAKFKDRIKSSPDRADSLILAVTGQAGTKLVANRYNPANKLHYRPFNIAWTDVAPDDCRVYVSIWAHRDGVHAVACFWGRLSRVLYVYGEVSQESFSPPLFAAALRRVVGVPFTKDAEKVSVHKVFGSKELFGKGRKSLEYTLKKVGIRVKPAIEYDEIGSVGLMNAMFARNMACIGKSCPRLNESMTDWHYKKGKPVDDYPLCRAFALAVAEFNADRELGESPALPAYSKSRLVLRERLKKNPETILKRDYVAPREPKSEWDYLTK